MDTQFPRFQVFLQETAGTAHIDVGSVHAPDIELALLNARDVFVRRPECSSLWVVPAQVIYSKTAEELREQRISPSNSQVEANQQLYYVFSKPKANGTQTFTGSVEASSPEQAMILAVEKYAGQKPPFAWWVFPADQALKSEPEDAGSFFDPVHDKTFRLSTDFRTVTAMREIKKTES